MNITQHELVGLAVLTDVVGAYGTITAVDDDQAHLVVELVGMSYRFAVEDGNDFLGGRAVYLLSIAGSAPGLRTGPTCVFVEDTAGAFEVPPGVAARIVARFEAHGICAPCARHEHNGCTRQVSQGSCRCRCAVEWAVARARQDLGVASPVAAEVNAPADPNATLVLHQAALPRRRDADRPCGCECSTGGSCGGCGHAGCAA